MYDYFSVREGLTLADAGLSNGVFLVLEDGKPPQDSEVRKWLHLIQIYV